jgi:hypothetical protein
MARKSQGKPLDKSPSIPDLELRKEVSVIGYTGVGMQFVRLEILGAGSR